MTTKLTDDERERRKLSRRAARNHDEYAKIVAGLAASIKKDHMIDDFQCILTSMEPYQPKGFLADLRRALYS